MSMLTEIARFVLPHLADAALHASVLVLFILALQTIMGSRLSPQWRTALWFLVVLRLAIPVSVPAPFSIYNVLPIPAVSTLGLVMQTEIRGAPASDASARPLAPSAPSTWTFDTMAPCPGSPDAAALPATQATPPSAPQSPPSALPLSLAVMLLLGWLSGALLVMGAVVRASMRCGRIARRAEPAGMEITLVSQEAARLMKARRPLPVRISDDPRCADIGPFLIGFLRPKVILPGSFARSASALDLRCVLMHEMAHRRCGDLHVNCLLAFLTAVHWFNPLVWIAFRHLRGERELLRDAMVLAHLQDDQRPHYARLLASFGGLPLPGRTVLPETPALAATMASRVPSLHRRVSMSLHTPRPERPLRTWIRYAVVTAIGAVTLTGAAAHTPAPSASTEVGEECLDPTPIVNAAPLPSSSPTTISLTGGAPRVVITIPMRTRSVDEVHNELMALRDAPGTDASVRAALDHAEMAADVRTNSLIVRADDATHALLSPVIARIADAPGDEIVNDPRDAGTDGTPWRAAIDLRGDLASGVIGMPCGYHQMFDRVTSEQGLTTYVRHLARQAPNPPPPASSGPVDVESWQRSLAPPAPGKYQSIEVPVRAVNPARNTRVTLGHELDVSLPGPDGALHTVSMLDGLSLNIQVAPPDEHGALQVSLQGRFTEMQPARWGRGPASPRTLHEAIIDVTRTIESDQVIMLMVPLVRATPIGVRVAEAPPEIIFDRQEWREPDPFGGPDPDRSPGYLLLFIRFDAVPPAEAHGFPVIPRC